MQAWAIPCTLPCVVETPFSVFSSATNSSNSYRHLPLILLQSRFSTRLLLPMKNSCTPSAQGQFFTGDNDNNSPDLGGSVMEEAREAIIEILREHGASEEDAWQIACNSPHYLDMIVGNVHELDEHSLWSSWSSGMEEGGEDAASLNFKGKVRCMAKSKSDAGLFPFLESLGVRHSSTMFIARYIASEKLPTLIDKVKYLKDMLFSSSENVFIIGKNARRMMMHLSIYTDVDIQDTLAFFEKIEAKHGGLSILDQGDASFQYLIESFPKLLMLSVEKHLRPLADFLVLIGISNASIRTVVLLFPPILFYNIENDIKTRLNALKMAGFGKDVGKILLKYPWLIASCVQKNYIEIVKFFTSIQVPKESVDLAIRSWPHILGCSTFKMNSMVVEFGQLGVCARQLGPVIASSPQLLLKKPDEFLKVVSFLKNFGFDSVTIGRILCRCPEIFAASVNDTLQRKVNALTHFGISIDYLPCAIRKYPELFLLDVNSTLIPRMRYLVDIGLSMREVSSMVSQFSPLLGYSIKAVFRPKFEFLLETMQKPLEEIVEYPRYFSYSLERVIKPRFWVLKSRSISCSLKDMLSKNSEEFAEEYMGIGRLLVPPAPLALLSKHDA